MKTRYQWLCILLLVTAGGPIVSAYVLNGPKWGSQQVPVLHQSDKQIHVGDRRAHGHSKWRVCLDGAIQRRHCPRLCRADDRQRDRSEWQE